MGLLQYVEGGVLMHVLFLTGCTWSQLTVQYDWAEMECAEENTRMMKREVAWGVPGRAYKTLPPGLTIAPSKIEGAGFGVLSQTFIPKYTWLGEYDGEVVHLKFNGQTSWYTWLVHRDGDKTALLDGFHFHLSSYHRYINAPLQYKDENVTPLECYGKIFYMTIRDITPGDELLVYYGAKYAKELGINFNDYFELSKEFIEGGLDLNDENHIAAIERNGLSLHSVKDLPLTWLPEFLKDVGDT